MRNGAKYGVFANETVISPVSNVSVSDVISGKCTVQFGNPVAWCTSQNECRDIRRIKAPLTRCNRPSRKARVQDVKRYPYTKPIYRSEWLTDCKEIRLLRPDLSRLFHVDYHTA